MSPNSIAKILVKQDEAGQAESLKEKLNMQTIATVPGIGEFTFTNLDQLGSVVKEWEANGLDVDLKYVNKSQILLDTKTVRITELATGQIEVWFKTVKKIFLFNHTDLREVFAALRNTTMGLR